jgi:hypothetical protein
MDIGKTLEYLVANTKTLKRMMWVILALLVVVDFFLHRHHPPLLAFGLDGIPGFSAVYGFVSCVLIIVVSKFLGHSWLSRPENYYDRAEECCDD